VAIHDASVHAASGPPFPLDRPTTAPWREHALSRIAEQRFLLNWMQTHAVGDQISSEAVRTITDHLDAAAAAAKGGKRASTIVASLTGSSVERAMSHLDAVETELLTFVPDSYLRGQLPRLVAHVRQHVSDTDPQRVRIEQIAARAASGDFDDADRAGIIAAQREASRESRREVNRLRSFRNVLLVAALVLAAGAVGLGVVGTASPSALPLCFSPEGSVVCPTSTAAIPGSTQPQGAARGQPSRANPEQIDKLMRNRASRWDIALIDFVGLIAAAVAAATALQKVRGTSAPHSLPVALALLKLPTGALTAVLGLLLMRGEFVPGLSALDSSAQIVAWAVIFGYAQQLLTRFIDERAQRVLSSISPGDAGSPARVPAAAVVSPPQPT
jgi:hypothetical protein